MQMICFLFLATMTCSWGTTLEVFRIFHPLSLHGTDVDYEFEGETIQARVLSRPMVLSGALPEELVSAVGASYRMPPALNYTERECNLLRLYGLELKGEMTGGVDLKIIIDLSASEVPQEVVLPLRTVLKLTISALKQTLKDSHLIENRPLKVTLELAGLTEKTGSLRDLAGRFEVGGR